MIRIVRRLLMETRCLSAETRWVVERLGYLVRPYDVIADARRWCWQPRERCQWSQRVDGEIDAARIASMDRLIYGNRSGQIRGILNDPTITTQVRKP